MLNGSKSGQNNHKIKISSNKPQKKLLVNFGLNKEKLTIAEIEPVTTRFKFRISTK